MTSCVKAEPYKNSIAVRPGRPGQPLANIFAQIASAAENLGGDPEITVGGDGKLIFGYDSMHNTAIISYNIPDGDDLDESILDAPKDTMDPSVWRNGKNGPAPTDKTKHIIDGIAEWAVEDGWTPEDAGIHIVGSIASNQYSDGSDVDVHFYGDNLDFRGKDPDDFNRDFRAAFKDFLAENPEYSEIGGHPVEVYVQSNKFQDMMSIGCYDYFSRRWESGPEIKDTVFDPYSEYYEKDMKYADHLISDIRNQILEVYEQALVLNKAENAEFKDDMLKKLGRSLKKAGELFRRIRESRKVQSSPKSKEDALKKRKDRKWHIADSTFKLMDKFGYLAILKTYSQLAENAGGPDISAADAVIDAVAKNIANNKMLTDSEKAYFNKLAWTNAPRSGIEGAVDEGIGSAVRAAALAGAMAMPFAARQADAAPERAPCAAQAAAEKKYAGLSESNMTNLLATIAYNEAMLDWIKDKDDDKLIAILNVIDNRAAGDPARYASVISEKSQFFSAKHVRGGYVDATYAPFDPAAAAKAEGGQLSPRQKECWARCLDYARKLLDKKLPSKIGNRNMIANKAKDNAAAWETWGRNCDLTIGSHSYGYDPAHDPLARAGKNTVYTVKPGDTLGKIAKAAGVPLDRLVAANTGIKNPDQIKVGQKITIPARR